MFLFLVSTFAGILTLIYLWFKRCFSYWRNRKIPYMEPVFPFGNLYGVGRQEHIGFRMQKIYTKLKGTTPFVGAYFFNKPVALITDLELVKNILIKDFNSFHDRHVFYNERDDPLSGHLFNIEGLKWRLLRTKLTPTFTSGKMKFMCPTVVKIGEQCVLTVNDMLKIENVIEIKELLSRYATDVIGTCAFGIECNSLKDPNATFRKMGQKMMYERRHGEIVRLFMELYRDIARALRMKAERDDVTTFFTDVLKETIEFREKNNVTRNDFMDLLIKLKNTGSLDGIDTTTTTDNERITFDEIAAQAYVFFLGGFEASSTTLGYCLYELALNQDIQIKARAEINQVLSNYDGKLTYEAMFDMKYIQQVIDETLRKYPPATDIFRVAANNYTVPGTNYIIEKDTTVIISIYSIQNDPDLYENPEKFDPDRFSPEAVKEKHTSSYIPFGDGPRNCIGNRFGKMQAYIALIMLLKNFNFSKCSKTKVPLEYNPKSLVLASKGGFWLKVDRL